MKQTTDFLSLELKRLEDVIQYKESLVRDVSEVSVGWHVDHTLKVINRVAAALQMSDPQKYENLPNAFKANILANGMVRGRGRAPRSVSPPDVIENKDLIAQLSEAKTNITSLDALHPKAHFTHHALGILDLNESKRFLEIHTLHHLAIIKDILTS